MRWGKRRRSCQTTILPTENQSRYGTPSALDSPTTMIVALSEGAVGRAEALTIARRGMR